MIAEVKARIAQVQRGEIPGGYKRIISKLMPEDWNTAPLKEAVIFLDEKRIPIKEADRIHGVYPYYGASGIIDYVNDFIFDGEYILMGEDGANILDRSSPLVFRASGKCWINNHAHVLQPRPGFDIDYLTNYLESLSYEKYNSGTAQPKLNQDVCGKIMIAFPPLAEQRKIADILSAQDTVITLTERLITEKQRQKQYLMQQLLTGKQRLPGFSGAWKTYSLYDVTERRTVRNVAKCDRVLTISGQYGLIEQLNFFDKTVASADKSNYFFLERDDFAYNKSRSIGYPFGAIKRLKKYDTGIVSPLYICFRVSGSLVKVEYMEHYFETNLINQEIQSIAQEGARNHGLLNVGIDDFFHLKVWLPPVAEQTAIADILSTADREIELLRRRLEQEQRRKKALSQLLLTGLVRVGDKFS